MMSSFKENNTSEQERPGFKSIAQKMKELEMKIKRLQEKSSASEDSDSIEEQEHLSITRNGGKKVKFKNMIISSEKDELKSFSNDENVDEVEELFEMSNENKNEQIIRIKREIEENIFKDTVNDIFQKKQDKSDSEDDFEEEQMNYMTPKLYLKDSVKPNLSNKKRNNSFGNGSTAHTNKENLDSNRKTSGIKVISVFKNFNDSDKYGKNIVSQNEDKNLVQDLQNEVSNYKTKLYKTLQINKDLHGKFETLETKYSRLLDLFEKTNKRLLHYKSELDIRKNCGSCMFKQKRKISENKKKMNKAKSRKLNSKGKNVRSSYKSTMKKKESFKNNQLRNSII